MRDDHTHIVLVLDRSGSMNSILDDTIGGVNGFVDEQKKSDGTAEMTVVTFAGAGQDHVLFESEVLDNVQLNYENYRPRGGTALMDCACEAIDRLGRQLAGLPEDRRPGSVVFVLMTDGQENSSRRFRAEDLKQRIEHQTEQYGWQFLYLGANQDAIAEGQKYGVRGDMSMTYGVQCSAKTMDYAAKNIRGFRGQRARGASAQAAGASLSFSDDQRDDVK